jgi:hypothetical protein
MSNTHEQKAALRIATAGFEGAVAPRNEPAPVRAHDGSAVGVYPTNRQIFRVTVTSATGAEQINIMAASSFDAYMRTVSIFSEDDEFFTAETAGIKIDVQPWRIMI